MLRMCLSPVSAGDFGSLPCIYIIPPCSHFPQTRFSSGLDEMEIVVELLSRDSIFWHSLSLSLSLWSCRALFRVTGINSSIRPYFLVSSSLSTTEAVDSIQGDFRPFIF